MDAVKTDLLKLIEDVIVSNMPELSPNNFNIFIQENPTLIEFLNNNVDQINDSKIRQDITNNISQFEYVQVVNKIKQEIVQKQRGDDITIRKIVNAGDITFTLLSKINSFSLDEENKKIYDIAIKYAMKQPDSHNLQIGTKNNNLIPMIKDSEGKIIEWSLDEKGRIITNDGQVIKISVEDDNRGFSDALILAFIIGSFIGIVFLNIYSKFIK